MNKQEAIEKIEKEKSNFNSWEDLTRNRALDDALAIVRKLDEPEKPVVPQFVADWYEDNKDDFEFNLYILCLDYNNCEVDKKLSDWFCDKHNKPLETLVDMHQFGYEVEKEKLYTAMLSLTGEYLRFDSEGSLGHFKVDRDYILGGARAYQFTEHTLIKYKVWENDNYLIEEVEE